MSQASTAEKKDHLFGHPTGLFTLFFAEMWERFSYYGMRALLVFYMTKGFLGMGDKQAYAVYGAYTALVYMTPYFGGMLADKLLGQRRAVVLGGLLMAAGHLLMTIETSFAFYTALALLICGNGFFKPNISTIVGGLYPEAEASRKDGGFTIFYMGINLGAAMSPILCGYVGETWGWHYGFGLATIGMLIGVAVFVAPTRLTQLLILGGALAAAGAMPFLQDSFLQLAVRIFLAIALAVAGVVAFIALGRGGLPAAAGQPKDPEAARRKLGGVLRADFAVLIGTFVAVAVFAFIVQRSNIASYTLYGVGVIALGYILYEAIAKCGLIERQRIFVILVLMFFSMLFWAFFEQAGSSLNNFADRNVDRVFEGKKVTQAEVGTEIRFRVQPAPKEAEIASLPLLGQEQLGYENTHEGSLAQIEKAVRSDAEKAIAAKETPEEQAKEKEKLEKLVVKLGEDRRFTMTALSSLRSLAGKENAPADDKVFVWKVTEKEVGMGLGTSEVPASEFQAANPIFILLFGLAFSALWTFLGKRDKEPSTTVKFALGLLQLGLGFGVLWWGAKTADARGMVSMSWLLLAYLLHTTGELCISPVGLSMVSSLSPARMVSTFMGAWFLATAFSQDLAAAIAGLTAVGGEGDEAAFIPPPVETVAVYGDVFQKITIAGIVAAAVCFVLSPLLTKWMHQGEHAPPARGGH